MIDGANRLSIAAELDLPDSAVPRKVVEGKTLDEKRALALSLNLDRRHLTQAEKQAARAERIVGVATDKRAGMSTREIADKHGVSQKQVIRDLKTAVESGDSTAPDSDRVTGSDGKSYPANKPRATAVETPTPVTTAPEPAQPADESPRPDKPSMIPLYAT